MEGIKWDHGRPTGARKDTDPGTACITRSSTSCVTRTWQGRSVSLERWLRMAWRYRGCMKTFAPEGCRRQSSPASCKASLMGHKASDCSKTSSSRGCERLNCRRRTLAKAPGPVESVRDSAVSP